MMTLTRAAAALLLVSSAAAAQSALKDTLYLRHGPFTAVHFRNDSAVYAVLVPDSTAPGGEREVGRMMSTLVVSGNSLARVVHAKSGPNEVTDSIVTLVRDLVPVSEISHQTTKLMHLRFNGRETTGDVTPTGKPLETVDHKMTVPPFNSSDVSLVAAALNAPAGYAALLATYEYESGGLRLDTLTVVNAAGPAFGPDRAHKTRVVRVSRGGGAALTYWVNPFGGFDQIEVEGPRGWVRRMRRIA